VRGVPLLAALTDNPGLLVVGFIIVMSIIQQLVAGKKAFDKTAARQRADRDVAAGSTGTPAAPPQPPNAAQARALLLAQIDAMAKARGGSAQSAAVAQQAAPQQTVAVRQPRRPAASQDPGIGAGAAGAEAVDRSFATLPRTLIDAPPSGLPVTSGLRAPSSTRRMLATAFGDPAHARSSVILAEVLGTPLGLR
jgi:hypothetical protein